MYDHKIQTTTLSLSLTITHFLVIVLFRIRIRMEAKEYSVSLKRHRKEPYFVAHHTKRQHHIASKQACTHNHSLILSTSQNTPSMLPVFVSLLLLLLTSTTPALSHHSIVSDSIHPSKTNQTYKAGSELLKLRRIRTHLMKINKPAVKTIQACIFLFSITSGSVTDILPLWIRLFEFIYCRKHS